MIRANFRQYDGNDPIGDFEREFESERSMFEWIRSQAGHPFLSIGLLDWEEIGMNYSEDHNNER